MKLKRIGKQSLVDAVVLQLRDTIEQTSLSSGDRLPSEPALVEQLGVSRTVLREAINRLQSIGLLTIKRGLGTYVADCSEVANCVKLIRTAAAISSADLIQFVEFREAIECQAARQAAEKATEEQMDELAALCRRMGDEELDDHGAMALDLKFHLRIAEITGNKLMLHVLEVIQEFIIEGMLRTTPRPRIYVDSCGYHLAFVDAMRRRNPDGAEKAVRRHMDLLLDRLKKE